MRAMRCVCSRGGSGRLFAETARGRCAADVVWDAPAAAANFAMTLRLASARSTCMQQEIHERAQSGSLNRWIRRGTRTVAVFVCAASRAIFSARMVAESESAVVVEVEGAKKFRRALPCTVCAWLQTQRKILRKSSSGKLSKPTSFLSPSRLTLQHQRHPTAVFPAQSSRATRAAGARCCFRSCCCFRFAHSLALTSLPRETR